MIQQSILRLTKIYNIHYLLSHLHFIIRINNQNLKKKKEIFSLGLTINTEKKTTK